MYIPWFTPHRRRRLIAQPFPGPWLGILDRNVRHYAALSNDEQKKLRDDLRILIAEKHWEGCGGLTMTDEIKVTIAAQACLLTLNIEHNYYARVRSILVYPTLFVTPHKKTGRGGIVTEGGGINSGEAWYGGPVILSWNDARGGGRGLRPGHNLVLHEFAHALDMMDGLVNGTPPIKGRKESAQWHRVMTEEFSELTVRAEQGMPTLLNQYGATNVGEFFAVATECFFEQGASLRDEHPRLYAVLRGYYAQDPARWWNE
jgi:MtfA peptidase